VTKEVNMRTKQWVMALMAMAVVAGMGVRWAEASTGNPLDATITVTPNVSADLSLAVTTYAFGSIPLSSAAVSASSLALVNIGQVNVGIGSKIQTEAANWVSDTSTGTINHYVLWVATSASQPVYSQFVAGSHRLNPYPGADLALAGIGGGSPNLATTGAASEVDLWFRLDTPSSLTTAAGQTITVRFTGTPE
jgi:hypothetical protein